MKNSVVVVFGLIASGLQAIANPVLLTDPSSAECVLTPTGPAGYGYSSVNIRYEGSIVFEGRGVRESVANSDMVNCRNIFKAARDRKLKIVFENTKNWHDSDFISLSSSDLLALSVVDRINALEERVQKIENK